MFVFPAVKVLGASRPVIIVQGGMGAGISGLSLVEATTKRGLIGVLSSAGLKDIVGQRLGKKVSHFDAAKIEVEEAIKRNKGKGLVGMNFMALMHTYPDSVRGAAAGGAKLFIVGAGLPLNLPDLVDDPDAALVPIVSSARAFEIIFNKWHLKGRKPAAVILEGPLAGGHLGFKAENIEKLEYCLEKLFNPVLAFAQKHGIKVIVAGGIWSREDIIRWTDAGADGVQLGTRFLATHESGATNEFKHAVVAATRNDIAVVTNPGSPSGMAFRVITSSGGYQDALNGKTTFSCKWGYMTHKGVCLALGKPEYFCICNGLFTAIGVNPDPNDRGIYTVGANADRVEEIVSANALIDELTGVTM